MDIRILRYDPLTSTSELEPHLETLNEFINSAFRSQNRSAYGEEDIFPLDRIKSPDQLLHELGTQGFAAIAFDRSPESEEEIPVAIACLKPWKGKVIRSPSDDEPIITRNDWEVALCASRNDPKYRGRGLVKRCLETLYTRLRELRAGEASATVLWITTLEGVGNVEYWQRRGFVRVGEGPDDAPVGTWGATSPFKIGTLRRRLD